MLLALILIGVWYWVGGTKTAAPVNPGAASVAIVSDGAVYPYECDEHVLFDMKMSTDANTISIAASNGGAYPASVTLSRIASDSGAKYEGGGYTFFGKGESVTLTEAGQSLSCSPVPSQSEAPFNFGD